MYGSETIWEFRTRNFRVVVDAIQEDSSPSDSFDDQGTVDAISSGEFVWFCARARVFDADGCELAADYLGACAYRSLEEFATSHRDPDPMNRNCSIFRAKSPNTSIGHYFPDMVREVVGMAREAIERKRASYSAIRAPMPSKTFNPAAQA
jgi:hypothetical protein